MSAAKNVKKFLQPTQSSTYTSCLSVCMLWHVEFLNEQECVHKRLRSPLHLGTQHDVFVQMISPACRQPNYLSSSVGSEPKRTSTLTHTHSPYAHRRAVGVPLSSPSVSWKLLLCCAELPAFGLGRLISLLDRRVLFSIIPTHWDFIWVFFFFFLTVYDFIMMCCFLFFFDYLLCFISKVNYKPGLTDSKTTTHGKEKTKGFITKV